MYEISYIITYCDYDGCDQQYKEYTTTVDSLDNAVKCVKATLDCLTLDRKALLPYDISTVMLWKFTAKLVVDYII